MPIPSDVGALYLARGLRCFGDGFATIILPAHLTAIGYDPTAIGIVLTASLLGTAIFTLAIGAIAPRHDLRTLMLGGALLIVFTGLNFPAIHHIAFVAFVAFIGTINPSTGDLGVLTPLEHAMLARGVSDEGRTHAFARYSLTVICGQTNPLLSTTRPENSLRVLGAVGMSAVGRLRCRALINGTSILRETNTPPVSPTITLRLTTIR